MKCCRGRLKKKGIFKGPITYKRVASHSSNVTLENCRETQLYIKNPPPPVPCRNEGAGLSEAVANITLQIMGNSQTEVSDGEKEPLQRGMTV